MKKAIWVVAALLIGSLSVPLVAKASADNIGYSFKVYAYRHNGKVATGRYRQTTHPENPWRVKMTSSTETKSKTNSITKFWLENSSADNVSYSSDVHVGWGYVYPGALSTASKRMVWLTAENNNYNDNVYTVKGYWDEETW